MNESATRSNKVLIWLIICAFLVVLIILIGGYTRLTNSGLSIVEWKPITGVIPPIKQSEWEDEFEKYKQFPEYKIVNYDMNLKEFKFIFMVEYSHRLLARILGIIFFIPLIYFSIKGNIKIKDYTHIIALGLIQGFAGWYMVKSGLVKNPSVSHYRLAIHFMLAVSLYSMIFLKILRNIKIKPMLFPKNINYLIKILIILTLIQMFLGCLVAGLDAGMIYNSFPLMGNSFIPNEVKIIGFAIDLFNDPSSVQFIHRTTAYIITVVAILSSIKIFKHSIQFSIILLSLILTQVIIGVLTIIYSVPISLGLIHQIFAILLLSKLIFFAYGNKK